MMTRKISRYPGDVPRANSINYDHPSGDPSSGYLVKFVVIGDMFQQTMRVSFYGGNNAISAEVDNVGMAGDDMQVTGQVTLPGRGLFQLILENPNVPAHAQPCWVYVD